MNYISGLIKKITRDIPKPTGRWNVEHCTTKINNKIDLSNEDHCGPCGYTDKKHIMKHPIIIKNDTGK
jgi:hypothetical protein